MLKTAMSKAEATCPMESLLRLLMGPWTPYILWILRNNGPMRFGALKRQVAGISAKVLTERLRLLEAHGLVHREHTPSIPPQVTYSLAERGVELNPALELLDSIARRWRAEDETAAAEKPEGKQAA